jgi:flagellar biogenesis protein FliO
MLEKEMESEINEVVSPSKNLVYSRIVILIIVSLALVGILSWYIRSIQTQRTF